MPNNHLYFTVGQDGNAQPFDSFEDSLEFLEMSGGIGAIHKIKTNIVYFNKESLNLDDEQIENFQMYKDEHD